MMGPMTMTRAAAKRPAPTFTMGDRIRRIRRDLGLSQAELAEQLGIGPKSLGAYESGLNEPGDKLALAENLERVTGVDRHWFIDWELPRLDSNQQPAGRQELLVGAQIGTEIGAEILPFRKPIPDVIRPRCTVTRPGMGVSPQLIAS